MTPPKIYGLIGYPIKHSLSPLMHNAAFSYLKISAEYRLFPLLKESLEDFLISLTQNNIHGLNITIPYKEMVIPFLDDLSDEARLIGAVNTIKVSGGDRLEGFNTDGEGFLKHLAGDLGFNPQDKAIAVIGAGGAAKAVCVCLSKKKPKAINIYDLDKNKAALLARNLKTNFNGIEFKCADSIGGLNIGKCDLLVNAAPVGMKETDPCLVDAKFLHGRLMVYDLIYNPKETRLLSLAKEKGASVSNGLGMLLYQGMLSFKIWTGQDAPKEVMQKALLGAL